MTQHILLFGAGRSATHLIRYLLSYASGESWNLTVVDANIAQAKKKVNGHEHGKVVSFDIMENDMRRKLIESADLVISLLPAHLHNIVAKDCLDIGRHLCTASYVSPEMDKMAAEARSKNIIFMGELGLDPGLDHMSALEVIDDIKSKGGHMLAFKSYTGGLVAPESDDNPWHYKISWNPRNVVLAGRGTATYLLDGGLKYIPYYQLFNRYELVPINGMGDYEMYANRDSLSYRQIYGIEDVQTIIRGTLRHRGYCDAWSALVQLGLTNDEVEIAQVTSLSDLLQAHIPAGSGSLENRVATYIGVKEESDVILKLKFLDLFSTSKKIFRDMTAAQIIEEVIKEKWKLNPDDKDMIIMKHEFEYEIDGKLHKKTSTLVSKGKDAVETAMSKLVGLPLAIFAKLVLTRQVTNASSTRPVDPEIYIPILNELKSYDVEFIHRN